MCRACIEDVDLVEQIWDDKNFIKEKVGFVPGAYVRGKYSLASWIQDMIKDQYHYELTDEELQQLLDELNSRWNGVRIIDDTGSTTYATNPDVEMKKYASFDSSYLLLPVGYRLKIYNTEEYITTDRGMQVLFLPEKEAEYLFLDISEKAENEIKKDGFLMREDLFFR